MEMFPATSQLATRLGTSNGLSTCPLISEPRAYHQCPLSSSSESRLFVRALKLQFIDLHYKRLHMWTHSHAMLCMLMLMFLRWKVSAKYRVDSNQLTLREVERRWISIDTMKLILLIRSSCKHNAISFLCESSSRNHNFSSSWRTTRRHDASCRHSLS